MKSNVAKFRFFLILMMGAVLSACGPDDYYLDITNATGSTIFLVYVSADQSDSWGEERLGPGSVLKNGGTFRVPLHGYSSSIFDVKLVDEDGGSYTYWKVDVKSRDIVATLADRDPP